MDTGVTSTDKQNKQNKKDKQKEDVKKEQEKMKHCQTKKRLLYPYYHPSSGSRYEVLRDLYRSDD